MWEETLLYLNTVAVGAAAFSIKLEKPGEMAVCVLGPVGEGK